MTPRLTICVGTRNRPKSLMRFLLSACRAATMPTNILIADASDEFSGAPDLPNYGDYVEWVDAYHEFPRLLPNQGYDRLVRKPETEYIAFFNDDSECVDGWDEIAVSFMDRHLECGIGCIYWSDPGGTPYLQSFQHLIYANFGIIRKTAGDKSGWFDTREVFVPELQRVERLTFYGNDVGLAFKMIDAGYAVVGIPGCTVKHYREQDEERAENNRRFVQGIEGNTAGRVLYELWGGIRGYEALRQKAAKFDYLKVPENP